ncbi:MAG TPA: cupin domain-containing protein [Candidatus Baltobacteraceae bacterium]|jgi:quercetin dioxygenase-like cupin family protein|nr:cupin domain-containing protein [Candidatus Baltobacteraceae bacterium]
MKTGTLRVVITALAMVVLGEGPVRANEPAYNAAVRVRTVLRTSVTQSGQPLQYPKGSPQATMLQVQIPPGAQTGWHTHPIPGFAYVESGRLTVQTRRGSHTFAAGEGFAETIDTPHNGRNLGRIPVKLIVIFTGTRGGAIVRKLRP